MDKMTCVWFRMYPPEPEVAVVFQEDMSRKDMPARDPRSFEYLNLFVTTEKTLYVDYRPWVACSGGSKSLFSLAYVKRNSEFSR